MDDETAVHAVLVPPQLARFRQLCQVEGAIQPRFDGYTKHVLLTEDRAFLFPRNHTIVKQLARECDVYATLEHPLVPKLLGRWDEEGISPYPFFAVTRLAGHTPGIGGTPSTEGTSDTGGTGVTPTRISPEKLPALAAQLGAAIGACHETPLDRVPQSLWANPWQEPPPEPPTALDCYSPLRFLGGAEKLAAAAAAFIGIGDSATATLLAALREAETMAPVLAQGDLHEGQLLVDASGSLTGILDWGFGGVLSPLVDFTGVRELFGDDTAYGEMRRHMWLAYAEQRAAPLPTWDTIQLAMTVFDITALAPETKTHYYWQHSEEWQAARRVAAGNSLRALLG